MITNRYVLTAVAVVAAVLSLSPVSCAYADVDLSLAEAIATGECVEGDLPCLESVVAADDDNSSDGGSKSDDKSSDDGSSKDGDSKSDDKSSDDGSSKDGDSKSDDKSSDDGSSKDGDSKSDDKSSDDGSSKDGDSDSDDKSSDDDSASDDDSSDDELPLPNVSIGDGQGEEFNNIINVPVVLTVSLDTQATATVVIDWITEDGTAMAGGDYLLASGQVSFAPGQQTADIRVFIIGDDIGESAESFFVRLSMASGASLLDDLGEVTILDDDDIDE